MAKECLTGEFGTCLPSCDGKRVAADLLSQAEL
jgi:hypothetical protein